MKVILFGLVVCLMLLEHINADANIRVLSAFPTPVAITRGGTSPGSILASNIGPGTPSPYVPVLVNSTVEVYYFNQTDNTLNTLIALFPITGDLFYTIFITRSGAISVTPDDNGKTTIVSTRFRFADLSQGGNWQLWTNGRLVLGGGAGDVVSGYTFDYVNSSLPNNLTQNLELKRNGVTVDTLAAAFFVGRTYTVYSYVPQNAATEQLALSLDFAPGALIPPRTLLPYNDLCAIHSISCPAGSTCRNGRCLMNSTELCRDYAGFDVIEVARDSLVYVDTQIQRQINQTVAELQKLKQAVLDYDPATRRLDLSGYHNALIAFCNGRNCTDTQCANNACTQIECQYPNSNTCVGLRQLEFLQVAFLGAIAVLNPGATCLQPYTAFPAN